MTESTAPLKPEALESATRAFNMFGHNMSDNPPIAAAIRAYLAAASPAPLKSVRNDEFGFVEFINADVPYVAREIDGRVTILLDVETRNVIGYRVYDAASPAPQEQGVKVLEWKNAALDGKFGWLIVRYSQTPFGRYYVEKFASQNYRVSLNEQVLTSILPSSIDEAISAAQSDYEARILSALTIQEPATDQDGAVVKALHEIAALRYVEDEDVYDTLEKALDIADASLIQEPASEPVASLDERMEAAGMIPLSKLLSGDTPLGKWEAHTGVRTLAHFEEWLLRRHREFMTMRARYAVGDKDESDELYEWVLAHSGAFSEVVANWRQVTATSILAHPPAPVVPADLVEQSVGWAYQDARWIDEGRWHLCSTEPRALENRQIQKVYPASAIASLTAERDSWRRVAERLETEKQRAEAALASAIAKLEAGND